MCTAPIETFETFVTICNKNYDSPGEKKTKKSIEKNNYFSFLEEETKRREIFTKRLERVILRQCEFDDKDRSYDSEINCFSDLTPEEFARLYTGQGSLAGGVCGNGAPSIFLDPNIDPHIFTGRTDRRGPKDYYGAPSATPKELDWSKQGKKLVNANTLLMICLI